MAIVNFSINPVLDKMLTTAVKTRGFSSKAEIFRVAVIQYLHTLNKPTSPIPTTASNVNEMERFSDLADQVSVLVSKKYGGKKLPSVREQLTGL